MSKKKNLLLGSKPPGALENAGPGTKRIPSDALALRKKEAIAKPVFTVFIGHRAEVGDLWEDAIKEKLQNRYKLRFFRFGDAGGFYPGPENCFRTEFLELVAKEPFDLILVYSHMQWGEIELFTGLRSQYGTPIIATSGLKDPARDDRLKAAGVTVLPFPFSAEELYKAFGDLP